MLLNSGLTIETSLVLNKDSSLACSYSVKIGIKVSESFRIISKCLEKNEGMNGLGKNERRDYLLRSFFHCPFKNERLMKFGSIFLRNLLGFPELTDVVKKLSNV